MTRNVAACPWASICPHRVLDVLALTPKRRPSAWPTCRDLDNLPRKFKINYSGCGGDCGQPHINCVGIVAVARPRPDGGEERGFRVVIGGGMGWRAFVAQPLYSFVPPEQIIDVCRAVGLLFRDHGDRQIPHVRPAEVRRPPAGHRPLPSSWSTNIWIEQGSRPQRVRVAADRISPGHLRRSPAWPSPTHGAPTGWPSSRSRSPRASCSPLHLAKIAELSEVFGDKHVYSTNRQNLELHGVAPERLPQLRAEIQALGLETEDFFGLSDVVSCVGTTYCPLAVSTTHAMFDLLADLVRDPKYAAIRDRVLVNITGCPNSCSPYRIADIGLRGLRIREKAGLDRGLPDHRRRHARTVWPSPWASSSRTTASAWWPTILDTFLEASAASEESPGRECRPAGRRAVPPGRRGAGHPL